MDDAERARQVATARSQIRLMRRQLRTLTAVLGDLEDALTAQPDERGTANGSSDHTQEARRDRSYARAQ